MSRPQTYRITSHQGDTLDEIVTRHGCTFDQNAIMRLNPDLLRLPVVLPYGTAIDLPYNIASGAVVPIKETLNLWS
jgi:phage tail protein X